MTCSESPVKPKIADALAGSWFRVLSLFRTMSAGSYDSFSSILEISSQYPPEDPLSSSDPDLSSSYGCESLLEAGASIYFGISAPDNVGDLDPSQDGSSNRSESSMRYQQDHQSQSESDGNDKTDLYQPPERASVDHSLPVAEPLPALSSYGEFRVLVNHHL